MQYSEVPCACYDSNSKKTVFIAIVPVIVVIMIMIIRAKTTNGSKIAWLYFLSKSATSIISNRLRAHVRNARLLSV